jgi:hypothetical protein
VSRCSAVKKASTRASLTSPGAASIHTQLRKRGKPANVAAVAAARELACFLWAAMRE